MKHLKILTIGLLLICNACDNDDPIRGFEDTGSIIGRDPALCLCCGGWFIDINNERFRFNQLPDNGNINLSRVCCKTFYRSLAYSPNKQFYYFFFFSKCKLFDAVKLFLMLLKISKPRIFH